MTALASDALQSFDVTAYRATKERLGSATIDAAPVADLAAYRTTTEVQVARPALSRREVQVLLAWLAADSKDEAAASLYISASTVSTHISRIRAKYNALDRPAPTKSHLLARALQDGYTTLDEW